MKYSNLSRMSCLDNRPLTLFAEAALTSASQSFSKLVKAGTKSFFVISGPTAV